MFDTKSLDGTHTKVSHIQFPSNALYTQQLNYTEVRVVYYSVHATWVYSNAAHGTACMHLSHRTHSMYVHVGHGEVELVCIYLKFASRGHLLLHAMKDLHTHTSTQCNSCMFVRHVLVSTR